MSTVTVSEARATLPEILDRVEHGDEVTITRHGHAVAVVVRIDVLALRRAEKALDQADQLHHLLERGRQTSLKDLPGIDPGRADELVEEVRASRDKR